MRANILYYIAALGLISSCSDSLEESTGAFLEGQQKTPIAIQTNLSAAAKTRAVDKKFESGDVLLAYIEAGVTTGGTFSSDGNPFKGLKTLKLTDNAENEDGDNHKDLYGYQELPTGLHITETDKLEQDGTVNYLYWDNYSSTEHDLRDAGAGIRLKYGYCFNGGEGSENADGSKEQGNISTALNQTAGTLGWTVNTDQSAAEDMKKCDLLFAKTQAPVSYIHGETETSRHGVLVLPYSHAMSKITINVTTGEGFSSDKANFESSELTLKHMNTVCSVDAPAGTVTSTTPVSIDTYKSTAENTTATFQAIVAPGTNLSVGNLLASIANIDNNNYDIPVTAGIVSAWSGKLAESEEVIYDGVAAAKPRKAAEIPGGKGYLTEPGVHYILNVTVDKQKMTIRATLLDWDKVKADGTAQIIFNPDVVAKGEIATELQAAGFDVYKSSSNDDFSTKSTTLTYAGSKWSYNPVIYWAGQSDNSYFRAISPAGASTTDLAQETDYIWGTSGNEAITPRTGDVPLTFEHLMSKLCINLQTVTGDAAVNLEGAKIAISNMATTATYSIVDGTVTAGDVETSMLSEQPSGFTEFVIPQTIGNDAKVTITLADGTTYSLQLNKCVLTGTTTSVGEWTKGKSYTYTIKLTKQEVTFSAVVRNWEEATASGSATLDWD